MPNIKNKTLTKETKSQLAKAERIGRGIRKVFDKSIDHPRDKMMHNRLSSAVLEWLTAPDLNQYSSALDKFSFTDAPFDFHTIWNVPIQVYDLFNGYTAVKIPTFNLLDKIKAPAGTDNILLFLTAGVCDVVTGKKICSAEDFRIFQYRDRLYHEETIIMKTSKTKGNLVVVGMSMGLMRSQEHPKSGKKDQFDMTFGIVAARYRG